MEEDRCVIVDKDQRTKKMPDGAARTSGDDDLMKTEWRAKVGRSFR